MRGKTPTIRHESLQFFTRSVATYAASWGLSRNTLGSNTSSWLRIPVTGPSWVVTELSTRASIVSQTTAIDKRTHRLPLLYLHPLQLLEPKAIEAASNKATHVVTFQAPLPPVGYSSFKLKLAEHVQLEQPEAVAPATLGSVSNGIYTVAIDQAGGMIESVTNMKSGASTAFNITWGYYASAKGGECTKEPNGAKPQCSTQPSGAYMFRPAQQYTHECDSAAPPTITVVQGSLVTEIRQVFASWATHIVRLKKGSPYIEVEWTAGPIPKQHLAQNDPEGHPHAGGHEDTGKELVLKFNSGIASKGTFYTDANGRELVKRQRDKRGPSYPPYEIGEPVAGNYYPVNSLISLDDGKTEMAVVTDTSMGGSSMADGSLEVCDHEHCFPSLRFRLNTPIKVEGK